MQNNMKSSNEIWPCSHHFPKNILATTNLKSDADIETSLSQHYSQFMIKLHLERSKFSICVTLKLELRITSEADFTLKNIRIDEQNIRHETLSVNSFWYLNYTLVMWTYWWCHLLFSVVKSCHCSKFPRYNT